MFSSIVAAKPARAKKVAASLQPDLLSISRLTKPGGGEGEDREKRQLITSCRSQRRQLVGFKFLKQLLLLSGKFFRRQDMSILVSKVELLYQRSPVPLYPTASLPRLFETTKREAAAAAFAVSPPSEPPPAAENEGGRGPRQRRRRRCKKGAVSPLPSFFQKWPHCCGRGNRGWKEGHFAEQKCVGRRHAFVCV